MEPTPEPPPIPDSSVKPPDRRAPSRARGESGGTGGSYSGRAANDTRRKRPGEGRYAGWGDGIERALCANTVHILPLTFPVESHTGTATIPMSVVDRRPGVHLLCNFSHCGAHAWPDGDLVEAGLNGDGAETTDRERA